MALGTQEGKVGWVWEAGQGGSSGLVWGTVLTAHLELMVERGGAQRDAGGIARTPANLACGGGRERGWSPGVCTLAGWDTAGLRNRTGLSGVLGAIHAGFGPEVGKGD